MEQTKEYQKIQGWGADLDHKNRPAYPKERIPARNTGVHWDELPEQEQDVEVFHSVERPSITPVFGTTQPPAGVSGFIRRMAYKMSENDIRRWLLLLVSDRVDMVEGIVEDLSKGHIPNIYKEMGLGAELKYNKAGFIKKAVVVVGLVGVGALLLQRRRQKKLRYNPRFE